MKYRRETVKIEMLCGRGRYTSCEQMQSNADNSGIIERGKCDYFSWARMVLRLHAAACAKRGFITQTFRCTPTINYFRYWLRIGPIRKVVVVITDYISRPRVTIPRFKLPIEFSTLACRAKT